MINKINYTLFAITALLLVPTAEAMQRKGASSSTALAAPSNASSPYEQKSIQSLIRRKAKLETQIDRKKREWRGCGCLNEKALTDAQECAWAIGTVSFLPLISFVMCDFEYPVAAALGYSPRAILTCPLAVFFSSLFCEMCCERVAGNIAKYEKEDLNSVQFQIRLKEKARWAAHKAEIIKQD